MREGLQNFLVVAFVIVLAGCGGSGSGEDAGKDKGPSDSVLGTWYSNQFCGEALPSSIEISVNDFGEVSIRQYTQFWKEESWGKTLDSKSLFIHDVDLSERNYSSTGHTDITYTSNSDTEVIDSSDESSPGFSIPSFEGHMRLSADGKYLYPKGRCFAGGEIQEEQFFVTKDLASLEFSQDFQDLLLLAILAVREQYDEARRELSLELSRRGVLGSSVADEEFAELKEEYRQIYRRELGYVCREYEFLLTDATIKNILLDLSEDPDTSTLEVEVLTELTSEYS